jgi:hypothetical protein
MDARSRKWLIAADSDPEYIKHCQIWDAAVEAGKPMPPETHKYFNDNCPVTNYLGMDSLLREELLALDETEGETQMRHYCRSITKGEQPPPETIEFFNRAFQEIQNGTELKQALRIEKKRGRKKTHDQDVLEMEAARIIEKRRADGSTWRDAVKYAEKYFHKDYETIKGYHKKYKKFALSILQQDIENKKRREKEELQNKLEEVEFQKRLEALQKDIVEDQFKTIMEVFKNSLEEADFQDMVGTFQKMLGKEKFQKILEKYKTR